MSFVISTARDNCNASSRRRYQQDMYIGLAAEVIGSKKMTLNEKKVDKICK